MQAVGAGLDVRVHPVVERLEVEHAHRRRVPREVGARLGVALTELAPLERELGRRRVRRQALERARAAAYAALSKGTLRVICSRDVLAEG